MRSWAIPAIGVPGIARTESWRLASWAIIAACVGYTILLRGILVADMPLWLDESYTAVLSAVPDLHSFVRHMRLDSNAPLYYLLMWAWPFESNLGLKLPSLIFMFAAGAVAALWRPSETARPTAFAWAALLLAWTPGITLAIDARYYALLLLLSTVQTIAFVRLIEAPTILRTCTWTGVSTLAILTHYYAAFVALFQGLAFLWMHRATALKRWPALLLLAPLIAWFAFHLPSLVRYAQPELAWYHILDASRAIRLLAWPLGPSGFFAGVVLVIAAVFAKVPTRAAALAAMAALAALLTMIGIGLIRPFMVDRYLLPVVPPLLLGLVQSVRPAAYLPLVLWFVVQIQSPESYRKRLLWRANYGLEVPAAHLADVNSASWYIDYSGSELLDPQQSAMLLADAFARHGKTIEAQWGLRTDVDGIIVIGTPDLSRFSAWDCTRVGRTAVCRRQR